ncbi:MAG TPA: hypothetical protein VFY46_03080, partial [Acidimicrobiia bacterium]|nr:hypothetical protein [Acidimicrobiia bacterium]
MNTSLEAIETLVANERLGARLVVVSEEGRGDAAVIDENGGVLAGRLPEPAPEGMLSDLTQL